jgi:deazaflavin-dependent oxidoreductase (nitroreductase family)
MSEITPEYNAEIIAEFRANDGRVGGTWEGTPLLLLHHTSARSGVSRVNPVAYLPDDRGYLIWAANGGAPNHPAWYPNLLANPSHTAKGASVSTEDLRRRASMSQSFRAWSTARGSRPSWTRCGSRRRRTPTRATRSPLPAAGSPCQPQPSVAA